MPPTNEQSYEGWPIPKLRLEVRDMDSPGARKFFGSVNAATALKDAVRDVFVWLYTRESAPTRTRSVTLVLRSMDGVAYTTGSELDPDHKEIHFSLNYIAKISEEHATNEIKGVLVHEMTHVFQYNGHNTCPGGLIEGIADYVRLRAGYVPPHWSRGGEKWDEGYQNTGYFLDYIERHYGEGSVIALNKKLDGHRYSEDIFKIVTGHHVDALWRRYKQWLADDMPLKEKLEGYEQQEKA